ncbi:MAG: UTP--glucose-1-phosphate uridylyltransferase, partial [Candidatus Omnitrophota bacterium]
MEEKGIKLAYGDNNGVMLYQMDLPIIDIETGELTDESMAPEGQRKSDKYTAPGGHGQWGVRLLYEALNFKQPEGDNNSYIRAFYNGDGISNFPDASILGWMARNNIAIIMISTTKAGLDKKGGQIGIQRLDNGTFRIQMLELAQAKKPGKDHEKLFYTIGLEGTLEVQGKDILGKSIDKDHVYVNQSDGQYFNTNIALINYSVLAPILQAISEEENVDFEGEILTGKELIERIISPDLIENVKDKKDGKKYTQLEGAIGSSLLNLNAFMSSRNNPILRVVNVPTSLRTYFFTPVKSAFDFWFQAYSDYYKINAEEWSLKDSAESQVPPSVNLTSVKKDENNQPILVKDDKDSKTQDDNFWADVQNVINSFGEASTRHLSSLDISGRVSLRNAILKGDVKVISDYQYPGIFDLNSEIVRKTLGQSINDQLILENITISIDRKGKVGVEKARASSPVFESVNQFLKNLPFEWMEYAICMGAPFIIPLAANLLIHPLRTVPLIIKHIANFGADKIRSIKIKLLAFRYFMVGFGDEDFYFTAKDFVLVALPAAFLVFGLLAMESTPNNPFDQDQSDYFAYVFSLLGVVVNSIVFTLLLRSKKNLDLRIRLLVSKKLLEIINKNDNTAKRISLNKLLAASEKENDPDVIANIIGIISILSAKRNEIDGSELAHLLGKNEEEAREYILDYLIKNNLLDQYMQFLKNNNLGLTANKEWLNILGTVVVAKNTSVMPPVIGLGILFGAQMLLTGCSGTKTGLAVGLLETISALMMAHPILSIAVVVIIITLGLMIYLFSKDSNEAKKIGIVGLLNYIISNFLMSSPFRGFIEIGVRNVEAYPTKFATPGLLFLLQHAKYAETRNLVMDALWNIRDKDSLPYLLAYSLKTQDMFDYWKALMVLRSIDKEWTMSMLKQFIADVSMDLLIRERAKKMLSSLEAEDSKTKSNNTSSSPISLNSFFSIDTMFPIDAVVTTRLSQDNIFMHTSSPMEEAPKVNFKEFNFIKNYQEAAGKIINPSAEEIMVMQLLFSLGQEHLFSNWGERGVNDDLKKEFLAQIRHLDTNYPGGLIAYQGNSRKLLEASRKGDNPFDGYIPVVPMGIEMPAIDDNFIRLEQSGLAAAARIAFVMVAGGLGERLGYEGIKIAIPFGLVTMKTYLEWYVENIIAIQKKANHINNTDYKIPLVIMVSDDTYAKTTQLLQDNDYYGSYGITREQFIIVKQEAVPALSNSNADFCLDPDNQYKLLVKPHGHGDVHMLLSQKGIVDKFVEQGITHTVFIQDTNGQVFNAVLTGLGVSIENDIALNLVTAPREAGEAVGAIAKLIHRDGSSMICNVEYNQLDPLLRSTGDRKGDVSDPQTGKSPFPGNLNIFIVNNAIYKDVLHATNGIIAEFVNPKYADQEKIIFKSPTRLETMMQDLAKVMGGYNVMFTNFSNKWHIFSPAKNNLKDASAKPKFPEAMSTAEADLYRFGRQMFELSGFNINVAGTQRTSHGVKYPEGAKVILSPHFVKTVSDAINKIHGGFISKRSSLVVEGENISIINLILDGALIIRAGPGVKLTVKNLTVKNEGWEFVDLTEEEINDPAIAAYLKIRGYKLIKHQQCIIEIIEPGEYEITSSPVQNDAVNLTENIIADMESRIGVSWDNVCEAFEAISYLDPQDAAKFALRLRVVILTKGVRGGNIDVMISKIDDAINRILSRELFGCYGPIRSLISALPHGGIDVLREIVEAAENLDRYVGEHSKAEDIRIAAHRSLKESLYHEVLEYKDFLIGNTNIDKYVPSQPDIEARMQVMKYLETGIEGSVGGEIYHFILELEKGLEILYGLQGNERILSKLEIWMANGVVKINNLADKLLLLKEDIIFGNSLSACGIITETRSYIKENLRSIDYYSRAKILYLDLFLENCLVQLAGSISEEILGKLESNFPKALFFAKILTKNSIYSGWGGQHVNLLAQMLNIQDLTCLQFKNILEKILTDFISILRSVDSFFSQALNGEVVNRLNLQEERIERQRGDYKRSMASYNFTVSFIDNFMRSFNEQMYVDDDAYVFAGASIPLGIPGFVDLDSADKDFIVRTEKEILDLFGGKAGHLLVAQSEGLLVPSGFVIPSAILKRNIYGWGMSTLENLIHGHLRILEKNWSAKYSQATGRKVDFIFNPSPEEALEDVMPLLVSVRSGAVLKMPGILDTILNVGINDSIVRMLAKKINKQFAYDTYFRFLRSYGQSVYSIPTEAFDKALTVYKTNINKKDTGLMSADELFGLAQIYKEVIVSELENKGSNPDEFFMDLESPERQLSKAIKAVLESWNSKNAIEYRQTHNISNNFFTPVTIMAMIYGNLNKKSGTGVMVVKNGVISGEYISLAQGDDVVSGLTKTGDIHELENKDKNLFAQLQSLAFKLEYIFGIPSQIEFTYENGVLWLLQSSREEDKEGKNLKRLQGGYLPV